MSFRLHALTSLFLAFSALLTLSPSEAWGCPRVNGLVDVNCDGKIKIVATGDSIVFGVGDEVNKGNGGYPLRLRKLESSSKIFKLGYPGITTARLLGFYRTLFRKQAKSQVAKKLLNADIIIVDVGRNDFFNRNGAKLTVVTIRRLVSLLSTQIRKRSRSAPLFVVAHLTPSVRIFDESFIQQVNELLFSSRSNRLPAYLRFDLMDPLLLSTDGLHPASAGYDVLATLADEYIRDDGIERALAIRKDEDNDGIYDVYEKVKFGTSPSDADTDGDGLTDGAEVFRHRTDPLSKDTDEDGWDDQQEILQGTNPRVPNKGDAPPEPTATPEA